MNPHKKSSFIMILLLVHLIFISNIIIFILNLIFPSLNNIENITFLQMIGSTVYFLIPLLIYLIIKKIPLNQALLLKPISIKNILIIVFLSIAIQPLLQLINALTLTFAENELSPVLNIFLKAPFWQLFLAVAVFPAILEEIVFRGIFIKEYDECSFWYSVFFSGLFFGIMHLTLTQLFYATVAGIFMAILVKVTGSIWSSILAHFVLNGTQITLGYISKNLITNSNTSISSKSLEIPVNLNIIENLYLILGSGLYFIVSIPFLVLGIYMFIKVNKEKINNIKNMESIKKKNNPKVFNIYFIVLLIIYFSYITFYEMIQSFIYSIIKK